MVTLFLLITLLTQVGADVCGNRCTSSQICGDDGKCYERSEYIKCSSIFSSIYSKHYCTKEQDCCGNGCMPGGSVCCLIRYCKSGHTCCGALGCCPPGTFCSRYSCISDIFSTQKPTTLTPRPTLKPRTTSKPVTRYPATRRPSSWTPTSRNSLKPWQYASIVVIVVVVLIIAVVVAIVLRKRHVQAQAGRKGTVMNAPAKIYGQSSINNGINYRVPVQTKRSPPQVNVAYIVTKPAVARPVASPAQVNNKARQLFSL